MDFQAAAVVDEAHVQVVPVTGVGVLPKIGQPISGGDRFAQKSASDQFNWYAALEFSVV